VPTTDAIAILNGGARGACHRARVPRDPVALPTLRLSRPRSLLHRPDGFGDRGLRREDGDELAADILQQHRVGVVVLAHLVELDALFHGMMVCSPGMSVAASASRIFSPSIDLARLMASAQHDQGHEFARTCCRSDPCPTSLEHVVDLADHRPLGGEIEPKSCRG